jgi:predicted GIY-YIG superfamily endonuclease
MPRTARELALSPPGRWAKGVRPCSPYQGNITELSQVISTKFGQDSMSNWFVYIVEKKKKLYVGITTDLDNRMREHRQTVPLYCEGPMSKSDALRMEKRIKGWSRKKKLDLIAKASSQRE